MATYFHGNSEIQPPDGLQTLILMNPGNIQYSDTQPPASSNLLFFNSPAGNPLYLPNLSHAPLSQPQHLVGIPLSAAASSDPNSLSSHSHHDISHLHGFIQRSQNRFCSSNYHLSTAARDGPRPKQGLSLTLSSHQPGYGIVRIPSEAQQEVSVEDVHIAGGSSASGVTLPAVRSISMSSKYLRAAQELLDEVANVGNDGVKKETLKKNNDRRTKQEEESLAPARDTTDGVEDTAKTSPELSGAERQEIQMKAAKFINMLDEVEQRYRQYHHQMKILVSSFEQAVGIGSARTFTALALQTISKQFRCLKDTIIAQIRMANKKLGKEDYCHGSKLEGSKLRFVDHQFHQQRALQNLGMTQHNAWRPQRGLPERSVSVLRAWLFEHFLHPYPKDSDKQILAKQTGLTRSQVSNWFINARVRLWKPMVEDMYMEEIKQQEQNLSADKISKNSDNTTYKSTTPTPQDKNHATDNQLLSLHPHPTMSFSSSTTSLEAVNVRSQSGFWLVGSSELDGITQGSPKRQRIDELIQPPNSIPINIDAKIGEPNNEHIPIKFNSERHGRDGYSFIGGQANFIGGFEQYPMTDIERFDAEPFAAGFSSNGVSLTLGLPHSENLRLSVDNHTFLPNQNINFGRNGFNTIDISTPHSTSAFGNIDVQKRKRLVAQLLPDFVT